MITEQELKDRCIPDIIKRMVELADGFECEIENLRDPYIKFNNSDRIFISELFRPFNISFLSTLIHRAVEGWNKIHGCDKTIVISDTFLTYYGKNPEPDYDFENYQPQLLTQCECAILHCLQEIFSEQI